MLESGNRRAGAIRVTLALLAFVFAAAAEATEGLYVGAEIVFADVSGTVNAGGSIASGNGVGFTGGYGISRHVAVEASTWSTSHNTSDGRTIDLQAALLDVKATFPIADSHIEPYLALGIGNYRLDTSRGDGWWYGAGMDISLSPAFSLNLGIARHAVSFGTDPKQSGDVTSMSFGIFYRFI
jgi:hypothetical protein